MNSNGKLIALLLGLSLAANFLVAGIWLGHRFGRPPVERFDGPARMDFSLRRLSDVLPADKRHQLEELLKGHRAALRASFDRVRASEEQIRTLIAADTVDREALALAIDTHETLMQDLHSPARALLLDVVADLDVETRRNFAENMFRRPWADHMRDRRFGDGPPHHDHDEDGPPPEGR